jgi:predicted AlkP superfamily phosphohydrolase/phosphomutase
MKKLKKAVILGIDGLDYQLTRKYLKRGWMPNLEKLGKTGGINKLNTTTPPQSPVAWSSFVTGKQPKDHGVWDFLRRDPKTYLLHPTFSPVEKGSPLKAEPFWGKTSRVGINTEVLFLPVSFPAEKINGRIITGMGTPDILGTEGTMFVLTTDEKLLKGKRGRRIRLTRRGKRFWGEISGPRYKTLKGVEFAKLDVEIEIKGKGVRIDCGREKVEIEEKEFSRWVDLEFKIGTFKKIKGRGRWFLRSIEPELVIHLSPINIDPENQVFEISYPKGFALELEKEYGRFSTIGLPHDSWALQEGIFDEEDFLSQAEMIFEKRREIILGQLRKFEEGLWVGYLGTLDSIQHMFWGDLKNGGDERSIVVDYYKRMDEAVGEVMKLIDEKTLLIVLSDHGFDSFDWEVNLNRWLEREGYLSLENGEGGELYEGVDWENTKAYAAGFNSVYLNVEGREERGVVEEKKMEELSNEIKDKLRGFEMNGESVIKGVYTKKDLGVLEREEGPDLVVGYRKRFRASWETAVGATPKGVLKRRKGKWCGDHLFDASEVPGVLFSNSGKEVKVGAIWEIMPKVLEGLGIN